MQNKRDEHPTVSFLKSLYQYCDEGCINLRFLPSAKNYFIPLSEIESIPVILEPHKGENAHFGVATREDGDRSKAGILQIPALWVDIDTEKLSEEAKNEIRQKYQDFPLKPSFLLNSGGGLHVYWLLKSPASKEEIALIESLLKRIALYFGGDMASTDASRLLRLPKTLNHKYAPPREVTIIAFKPKRECNLSDFDFLHEIEGGSSEKEKSHLPEGWQEELLDGVSEGERNNAITRLAGRYLGKNLSKEEILPILLDANSRFKPPLPPKEVETCLDSILKTHQRNHPGNETPVNCQEMIREATLETLPEILKVLAALRNTEQAVHVAALASRLNVPKSAIQRDIKKLISKKDEAVDIDDLLEGGADPKSNHSAQNFIDGVLSFGAMLGDQRVLVKSNGEILLADGDGFRFKRSTLTPDAIKRFRDGDDIDGLELIGRIKSLFADHVIFKDDRIPLLLATWTLGTYIFKMFRFYGYLLLTSPVKRCGKSLVLDIIALLAFNSTPRMVNPSPSSTFREVNDNDATLIIDEVESLSDADKEKKTDMIGLLNGGFQRGSVVSRTETKNKEFIVCYFSAYCPKALAGIKGVADTVEDRSLKIMMGRKSKKETIKRFNVRALDSHLQKIRDDLFIWALKYGPDVATFYDGITEVPGTEALDDRLKDILEPLLAVASIIDAQADDDSIHTVKTLVNLSKDMAGLRESQEELNGSIPAAVAAMKKLVDGVEEFVSVDKLYSHLKADDDMGFLESKKAMAGYLSKLGIDRAKPRLISGATVRGYILKKGLLDDLGARYA